jgi:hypothetical protein
MPQVRVRNAERCTSATSLSACSSVTVSGFSQKTGIPAARHFIAGSKCTLFGVTIRA